MDIGSHSLLILLAAYLLLYHISLSIYRLYFHPLAKVPGPRLAAITSLWYAYQIKKSQLLLQSREFHAKYGPAVRIGPNEVQFDSKEAFQAIYGGTGYLQKSDFYYTFNQRPGQVDWLLRRRQPDDGKTGFTINGELNIQRHRSHRRNIGATYLAASVRKYGARVDEALRSFVTKLRAPLREKVEGSQTLDLAEWIHVAVVECLGAVTLGQDWSPGLIEARDGLGHWDVSIAKWRQLSVLGSVSWLTRLIQGYPGLRPKITAICGLVVPKLEGYVPMEQTTARLIKEKVDCFSRISSSTSSSSGASDLNNRPGVDEKRPLPLPLPPPSDMLEELLHLTIKKAEFKPDHAAGMANLNFVAGRDTTTATITAALALICANPAIKARVEAEVLSACARGEGGSGIPDMEKCRYTQACVKETLRVRPVSSLSMSRVVPSGTRKGGGTELHLHGYNFAPGTVVGVNVAAMHLNPAVFGSDAAEFRPERWLREEGADDDVGDQADDAMMKTLEKTSLSWGAGAHVCPGRHLAELIIARLVPLLVSEFDVEIVEMPRIKDMRSFNYFAALSGVKARFRPR